MKPLKKCTATKSLLLAVLLGSAAWVQAAPGAGVVTHLSGPLFVNKADGSMRILSAQSTVEAGDTVSTQGKGYAQIRLSDDSQLTLKPRRSAQRVYMRPSISAQSCASVPPAPALSST